MTAYFIRRFLLIGGGGRRVLTLAGREADIVGVNVPLPNGVIDASVGPDATVADVRRTFDNFANIDMLDFKPEQLDISKEGGEIVIAFSYEKRIHLFYNVNLLIDFNGSTAGRN